ncbi:MAG: tyrosine-type recombinase/integrase [Planctomycetaceae bacterium]
MRRHKLRASGPEWLLVKRRDRKTISIKYRKCPRSPWQWGSSGVTTKKDAGKIAASLVQGWLSDNSREVQSWKDFRERYEREHLSGLAAKTQEAFRTAANRLEELCTVRLVQDLDSDMFSRFAYELRNDRGTEEKPRKPKAEATIQAYRDHLMMALEWAKSVRIIAEKPKPPRIKRAKKDSNKSRGRALSREEAERIVLQLPKVVGAEAAKQWAWNLEALWRSGMRIAETYFLTWEQSNSHFLVDLDGRRPMIAISAEHEKGNKNRLIPITPDFAKLLREIPIKRRRGRVFSWPGMKGEEVSVGTVEKRLARAGQLARVVVGQRADQRDQFATAHDWRRSFGARWAPRVMPVVLKDLMRHESIETTMRFYVGNNAERNADAIWMHSDIDFGAKLGDMLDSLHAIDDVEPMQRPVKHGET